MHLFGWSAARPFDAAAAVRALLARDFPGVTVGEVLLADDSRAAVVTTNEGAAIAAVVGRGR